jgi:hypothetical protein
LLTPFPKRHIKLLGREKELVELEKIMGQSDRARPYAQKAVDILTALFPHGHPNLVIIWD